MEQAHIQRLDHRSLDFSNESLIVYIYTTKPANNGEERSSKAHQRRRKQIMVSLFQKLVHGTFVILIKRSVRD